MKEWVRHTSCGVEVKDYFNLICDEVILCSVFLNGNVEWVISQNGNIDICDSRSEAFDFAEGRNECEGIKRIRNKR